MYNWQLTHPQVVYRAKGLDDWINSGAYDRILSGDYIRDVAGTTQLGEQTKCPRCKTVVTTLVRFCRSAASTLSHRSMNTACIHSGFRALWLLRRTDAFGTRFCVACGTAADNKTQSSRSFSTLQTSPIYAACPMSPASAYVTINLPAE
jgi:phage FluMu protein Com